MSNNCFSVHVKFDAKVGTNLNNTFSKTNSHWSNGEPLWIIFENSVANDRISYQFFGFLIENAKKIGDEILAEKICFFKKIVFPRKLCTWIVIFFLVFAFFKILSNTRGNNLRSTFTLESIRLIIDLMSAHFFLS